MKNGRNMKNDFLKESLKMISIPAEIATFKVNLRSLIANYILKFAVSR